MGFKVISVVLLSSAALAATGWGTYAALHSSLFTVQVVEVADQPEQAPIDAAAITQLAAVPVGQVSLVSLDLKAVEQRIRRDAWVREVRLQKRFPQTLSIAVSYREPRALIQLASGDLSYVDPGGKVFGEVSLSLPSDLPVLSGFTRESAGRIPGALRILDRWDRSPVAAFGQIASITWDAERGYRALVAYSLGKQPGKLGGKAGAKTSGPALEQSRTMVELGTLGDELLDAQLKRLAKVFGYLSSNAIASHQIWADSGKKIVVKTARGS